jgi:hypothetical protein
MWNCFAIFRNFLKFVCAVLLLSQSLDKADATLKPMESIAWSFGAAGVVALLRVDDIQTVYVENDHCGVRYTATILRLFKGRPNSENGQKIQFGRFLGLEIERTYLAFLDYDDDPEIVYRRFRDLNHFPDIRDDSEKKWIMSRVECNGLVPGLEINEWFTWPVVDNYVIVTGLMPANMPAGVRVYPTDTSQWWIQKQDISSRTLTHLDTRRIDKSYELR